MANVKEKALDMSLDLAMGYLEKDPEENLPRLMAMARRLMPGQEYKAKLDQFDRVISDKDDNMHKLLVSLFTDIDSEVRKTCVRNFILNAFYKWSRSRNANEERYGCSIPWTILIDPTSACNLKCTGCWAAEYGNRLNLSGETLDGLISQAEALDMHFFLYSGGEPLVKKDLIIEMCSRHPDSVFSCFTNGTLIDEDFAREMLRVKNFVPAISVEGFGEATDSRRGNGTFDKVVEATCENELVAPIVQDQGGRFTKVVLFSRIPFELTTKADRIRTCYMQACLAYVNFSVIGNSDVRRAFGLGDNKSQATRIIKDTLAAGLIKPVDSAAAPRYVRYIPFWG